jgi:Fe-S cluster assembly protein SufD
MAEVKQQPATKETDLYLKKFERFEEEVGQPEWVSSIRKAGIARFGELGFPTLQHEDWRFTNIAPIVKLPFKPVFRPSPVALGSEDLTRLTFAGLKAARLVFVNGHYSPRLSTSVERHDGVALGSLAAAVTTHAGLLQEHVAGYAADNAFVALNQAFFRDGAFIHVPAGMAVEEPIHLLFVSTASEAGVTAHPRNLIIAGKGSRVTVLESYTATADAAYFTNAATEFVVGDGAAVEHCKFQDESTAAFHIATLDTRLGRSVNFISHSIATGARLSRNNIRTELAGEGAECTLNGLYLTHNDQHADHHMIVDHVKPHCNSHEYFNGILDGRSKGVFHGRILVRQEAQKTDAKQTNKNILLSDEATVDTKPQLEIYADDVKCTHGATVGQLNEESIFYLRSRGIGANTARRMLIHAFASEIIQRIRHEPAREELDKLVWERLEANPHLAETK